jgi:hypothetical protein
MKSSLAYPIGQPIGQPIGEPIEAVPFANPETMASGILMPW